MNISTTTRDSRLVKYGLPLAVLGVLGTACSSGSSSSSSSSTAAAGADTVSSASLKVSNGHLSDGAGRTVYQWTADTGPASTCTGACASAWPPVPASSTPSAASGLTASDLGAVKRADGTSQLSYAGHPLYYFSGDKAAGDAKGQGSDAFGSKWWELDGSGQPVTTTTGGGSPSSSSGGGGGGGYGY